MPKIDQYLKYVKTYTELSKISSLCIPSSLRPPPSNRPPEHLYGSLVGSASTVCSAAVLLISTVFQWRFFQTHDATSDCIGQPEIRSE
jgi:hypothetical protein